MQASAEATLRTNDGDRSETAALLAFRDSQPAATRAEGGCLADWVGPSACAKPWRGVSLSSLRRFKTIRRGAALRLS